MRTLRALLIVVVVGGLLAACGHEPQLYSAYRESKTEEIPGTWGLMLSPPDEGWNPTLSPAQVLDRFAADTPRGSIMLTLANVSSSLTYVDRGTPSPVVSEPAWVFMSRGVCFSSEKGALVASARRPDSYNAQRCSLKNISVMAVDADDGSFITTERGYDASLEWMPARQGSPVLPGTQGTPSPSRSPRPAARASNIHEAPSLLASPSP